MTKEIKAHTGDAATLATEMMATFEAYKQANEARLAEIEAKGTEGAFTKQARRAGYKDTMEFARAVMDGWRSGKKKVFNKKTRRLQRITEKTMDRANFALNVQKRRK